MPQRSKGFLLDWHLDEGRRCLGLRGHDWVSYPRGAVGVFASTEDRSVVLDIPVEQPQPDIVVRVCKMD